MTCCAGTAFQLFKDQHCSAGPRQINTPAKCPHPKAHLGAARTQSLLNCKPPGKTVNVVGFKLPHDELQRAIAHSWCCMYQDLSKHKPLVLQPCIFGSKASGQPCKGHSSFLVLHVPRLVKTQAIGAAAMYIWFKSLTTTMHGEYSILGSASTEACQNTSHW